jgi:hypothetical protein
LKSGQLESTGAAFERWYSAPEQLDVRKAIQLSKSVKARRSLYDQEMDEKAPRLGSGSTSRRPYPDLLSVEPTQVGGSAALDVNTSSSEAYEKLVEMAAEMRRTSPHLSTAQAFERVFANPTNVELANKAHRRPDATTSYAFPR